MTVTGGSGEEVAVTVTSACVDCRALVLTAAAGGGLFVGGFATAALIAAVGIVIVMWVTNISYLVMRWLLKFNIKSKLCIGILCIPILNRLVIRKRRRNAAAELDTARHKTNKESKVDTTRYTAPASTPAAATGGAKSLSLSNNSRRRRSQLEINLNANQPEWTPKHSTTHRELRSSQLERLATAAPPGLPLPWKLKRWKYQTTRICMMKHWMQRESPFMKRHFEIILYFAMRTVLCDHDWIMKIEIYYNCYSQ